MLRLIFHLLIIAALTLLTQIGGVGYLIGLMLTRARRWWIKLLGVSGGYAAVSIGALFIAPLFGREPLPCLKWESRPLAARSVLYCALNRHYVTPDLHDIARAMAADMARKYPGTQTLYLDAGFPFGEGFPMLPHLSHDDGEKLDFAYFYRDGAGYARGQTPSPLGYWGFMEPHADDPATCPRQGWRSLRWDMRWFQRFVRDDLEIDAARTSAMLRWLSGPGVEQGIGKVLLEPHLRARFALPPSVVRFQGCRAARHDDHVHVQLR